MEIMEGLDYEVTGSYSGNLEHKLYWARYPSTSVYPVVGGSVLH